MEGEKLRDLVLKTKNIDIYCINEMRTEVEDIFQTGLSSAQRFYESAKLRLLRKNLICSSSAQRNFTSAKMIGLRIRFRVKNSV